jgi:hypothetical protein
MVCDVHRADNQKSADFASPQFFGEAGESKLVVDQLRNFLYVECGENEDFAVGVGLPDGRSDRPIGKSQRLYFLLEVSEFGDVILNDNSETVVGFVIFDF